MYRQGDVLLVPMTMAIPAEATAVARDAGRVVLAYGEVTGHAHAICEPGAELFTCEDGRFYLNLPDPVELVHEEHDTIPLPAQRYRVYRQREYTPERIVNVAD